MRLLRRPLVLRALALVLLAGIGAAWVPVASARDARADALRSLLDDADAFERALRASRSADGDALDVFVETYAEAAGDAVSPEAVRQLLRGQGVGAVAPVLPDLSFVPAPAATAPGGHPAPGVLGERPSAPALAGADAPAPPHAVAAAGGAAWAVQARGP